MKRKTIINVSKLNKTFRIPHERMSSFKQVAVGIFKKKSFTNFHVLKDITFKVYEGEFFGVVGRNGCGKSTLLKILAGIYMPDSGTMEIGGSISPFLELGVGFNPELSGRENVFLNGAILGLSKTEIENKYDAIVAFSELEEFMDQKLKNYSSGMQVRLAFSVAINAHAPILLLDEVLAVGDARFQKKCHDVFIKMKKEKRTIVFVTHDMVAVKEFCDRAILISNGKIVADGDPIKVANEYLENGTESEATEVKNLKNEFALKAVCINNQPKENIFYFGEPLDIDIKFKYTGAKKKINAHLAILDENNETVIFSVSKDAEYRLEEKTDLNIHIEDDLAPGTYHLALSLHDPKSGESYYGNTNISQFRIQNVGSQKAPIILWK